MQPIAWISWPFSPQGTYTDWSTATCRRFLVSAFADRGALRGQRCGSPTAFNLSFLDRSRYFFFQVASHLSSRGWVDPVPDPLRGKKCGSTGNRPRDILDCCQKLWPLDHRGSHECMKEAYWNHFIFGFTESRSAIKWGIFLAIRTFIFWYWTDFVWQLWMP
jgi:hypothetical protein